MLSVEVIGLAASVITGTQVIRQLVDVFHVTDPRGVAWGTWALAFVQSVGLLILSIDRGLLAGTLANALVGALCIPILIRVLGGAGPLGTSRWIAVVGGTLVVCLALATLGGAAAAGTLGSLASTVVWVPQAVRSVRTRSPMGLSWMVVLTGLVSSALWTSYAVLVGQWQLVLPPLSAIVALSFTGFYALRKSRVSNTGSTRS